MKMSNIVARDRKVSPVMAYLGLGSNLGDRADNIARALDYLSEKTRIERVSSLYDTSPVGFTEQPRFLNAVCRVSTGLSPQALLDFSKAIEKKLGRQVSPYLNAPRIIDIDILLYGNQTLQTPSLTIPHPRMFERAFVLVPLAQIAGDLLITNNSQTISQLVEKVAGKEGVIVWK
ncbi:MAG: folK [Dehalococcoidia bacterium]|nr:folK [Dehalococcoidia bacterium]